MIKNRHVLALFTLILSLFFIIIYYFMSILTVNEVEVKNNIYESFEQKIYKEFNSLPDFYHVKPIYMDNVTEIFFNNVQLRTGKDLYKVWKEANEDVIVNNLFRLNSTNLGDLIHGLKTAKIIRAELDGRGTQLKFLLTLEGDQTVIFKPQWYENNRIIEGPVYAGKDRYHSEILSFYLSAILNRPIAPVTVKRTIHLQNDIISVASKQILNTTYKKKNSTCIYGLCYYCKKEDPICDVNGILNGAVIFNLGANLRTYRSPWQRTYKKSKRAVWETNDNFCKTLVGKLSKQRLIDLIETSIFDFLIQNGDRHHYETFHDRVVWIDNGKGLGNPNVHHIDILAPLYQCCMLRHEMWKRLRSLSGGLLVENLRRFKDVTDIISEKHFSAIEQRLLLIYATVELCKKRNKSNES